MQRANQTNSGPTSKAPAQRARILALLRERGPAGASNNELNAIGFRYGARIWELRRQGYAIRTVPEGEGAFRFILEGEPRTAPGQSKLVEFPAPSRKPAKAKPARAKPGRARQFPAQRDLFALTRVLRRSVVFMLAPLVSTVFGLDVHWPTKLLLLAILDECNKRAECSPSIPRLARKTGLPALAVQKQLAELEAAGALCPLARRRSGAPARARIDLAALPQRAPYRGAR